MKKNRLFFMFAALFVAAAVMFSCQKEETPSADMSLRLKSTCTGTLPTHATLPSCGTACLQQGPYEQGTNSYLRQPGSPFTVDVPSTGTYYRDNMYFVAKAWNTSTQFNVEVTSMGFQYNRVQVGTGSSKYWQLTGPTCVAYPFTSVAIYLADNLVDPYASYTATLTTETEYTFTFDLEDLFPEGWEACDEVDYTVVVTYEDDKIWIGLPKTGGGADKNYYATVAYPLFANCVVLCETEMDGATECGVFEINDATYTHKAVFTYTPEIDGYVNIQGGLAAKWASYYADFDGDVFTQTANTKSNAAVYSYAGDVVACQTYTITVYWTTGNEDAEIIDEWTAELSEYVDGVKVLFNIFSVDPMECEDSNVGYITYPVE